MTGEVHDFLEGDFVAGRRHLDFRLDVHDSLMVTWRGPSCGERRCQRRRSPPEPSVRWPSVHNHLSDGSSWTSTGTTGAKIQAESVHAHSPAKGLPKDEIPATCEALTAFDQPIGHWDVSSVTTQWPQFPSFGRRGHPGAVHLESGLRLSGAQSGAGAIAGASRGLRAPTPHCRGSSHTIESGREDAFSPSGWES